MRYFKIASNKNPDNDFIELNDIYGSSVFDNEIKPDDNVWKIKKGFLCVKFETLGISRKLEFLKIKNRNIEVDNQTEFKKYNLTLEIMTKYSEYEATYRELINFLDRNKKGGIRLYYDAVNTNGSEARYCLCSIELSTKIEKRQPVGITVTQNSLWLGAEDIAMSSAMSSGNDNIFSFGLTNDVAGYYAVSFSEDNEINNYYSVAFDSKMETQAVINNESYNEIPLIIRVEGFCVNPVISLFDKNGTLLRTVQVFKEIEQGSYLELNANILENGVWKVDADGRKHDYSTYVGASSPYFYIEHGKYSLNVSDEGGNKCVATVIWQEEWSE